jgi:undecaprenyl diphosphate synthase
MHVAIIMDGNGRWAEALGRPRLVGHEQGARRIRAVVEASPALGIDVLTLYAFSSDNWKRPSAEVAGLMALFDRYLVVESPRLKSAGVRLSVIGRRDRLSRRLVEQIATTERMTACGKRLHLRLAIDYSARDAMRRAAIAACSGRSWSAVEFERRLRSGRGVAADTADVDILIRTGGEQRLSDFLLWECAYAELWFTATPWPAFTARELARAIGDFRSRERRFGGLAKSYVGPSFSSGIVSPS